MLEVDDLGLDNADRVPMNIVVDEVIAVLQILAFRNAIRSDEQVEIALEQGAIVLRKPCRNPRQRPFRGLLRASRVVFTNLKILASDHRQPAHDASIIMSSDYEQT